MRIFKLDGKDWVARLHDLPDARQTDRPGPGWEVIQFDTDPAGPTQKISFRPPGWLAQASIAELIEALREGESVRAHFH